MDTLEKLSILNETIKNGEFLHPYKLGVPFEYFPNPYTGGRCFEKYSIFVDDKDENVYMYLRDVFSFVYKIKTK